MLSIFRHPRKEAERFLQQHTVGQKLFTAGDGGRKFGYMRDHGYIRSERVGMDRWCHEILKKPTS